MWGWLFVLAQETNRWQKFTGWIFSIDSILNRVTINFNVVLRVLQFVTSRNQNLLLNKIYTCNFFSNGMLDLQTCVHFQKVKVFLGIHQEFYCTCCMVVTTSCQSNSLVAHSLTSDSIHRSGWSLFNYFLISSLN